jgi:DNA-binding winged helix-turn-helix (wHTH) protein
MAIVSGSSVRFGSFLFDLIQRKLTFNANVVPLKPKEADLLALLVNMRPHTVPKDEIVEKLWPHSEASDAALSQTVYRLRRTLAEKDPSEQYIRTVPGIGFAFIGTSDVDEIDGELDFARNAFSIYRRATHKLHQRNARAVIESIALFRLAIARDPHYTPARIGLAKALVNAGIGLFVDPAFAYREARAMLEDVIEREPASAEAFAVLAVLLLFFDNDPTFARSAAEFAFALDPHVAVTHTALAWELLARGDLAGALSRANHVLRMDPSSVHLTSLLGITLYMSRRFDDAHAQFADALAFDPFYAPALLYDACAFLISGEYDRAEQRLLDMLGNEMATRSLAARAVVAARRGDGEGCEALRAQLRALPIPSHIAEASISIERGDLCGAAALLRRARTTHEPALFMACIDPLYRPLFDRDPGLLDELRSSRPQRYLEPGISHDSNAKS